jgi:hypothetical protein
MKKEKVILLFVATLFGLLVAGIVFYLFQATRTVPNNTKTISLVSPTPTETPSISLTVDRPTDEQVANSKVLVVSGKTQSNAVVVVLTDSSQDVITPSANGDFSTSVNLDDGENILEITSIAPNGESMTIKKTITYSLEEF